MANKQNPESGPNKNEAPRDPAIRERAERLTEKLSDLKDTLGKIEKTLEEPDPSPR